MPEVANDPIQPRQLQAAPRCGAKTRRGTPCMAPAVSGKKRCRLHGCGKGSGAQPGNRNAWKHGNRSAENERLLKEIRALWRSSRLSLDGYA